MATRFQIEIGDEVLYFDEAKRPSQPFQPVGSDEEPALLWWPDPELEVTGQDWDPALKAFSQEQRRKAIVRVVTRSARLTVDANAELKSNGRYSIDGLTQPAKSGDFVAAGVRVIDNETRSVMFCKDLEWSSFHRTEADATTAAQSVGIAWVRTKPRD